jgi:hypothetical protein
MGGATKSMVSLTTGLDCTGVTLPPKTGLGFSSIVMGICSTTGGVSVLAGTVA